MKDEEKFALDRMLADLLIDKIIKVAYRDGCLYDVTEYSAKRFFERNINSLFECFCRSSIIKYMESKDYQEDMEYYYEHRRDME